MSFLGRVVNTNGHTSDNDCAAVNGKKCKGQVKCVHDATVCACVQQRLFQEKSRQTSVPFPSLSLLCALSKDDRLKDRSKMIKKTKPSESTNKNHRFSPFKTEHHHLAFATATTTTDTPKSDIH